MTPHSRARRWIAAVLSGLLLVIGLVSIQAPTPADAVTGSQFDPGLIISDQYFFDGNAMSEAQIQSFLDAKIGACSNSNCLNVLRVDTASKPAKYSGAGNLVCNAYSGALGERASTIIFKVQQACGISAKALLVTLQKEQGLVTKKSVTAGVLERAMGYGCPDNTGGTCIAEYYGFYNQMYWASWQLKRYGTPAVFGVYQPGWNTIQWHPNAACGASSVFIHNRATAALYNYTPYRPNAAALGNLYGGGDGCSSYGNRNFWVYYNDWFGSSTLPPGTPEGSLSSITTSPGKVSFAGWAVDPDAVTGTVPISIQLGASWVALYANKPGTDLTSTFPGAGASHDFSGSFDVAPGTHAVCIYLVNAGGVGGAGNLGCHQITVPAAPPASGAITSAAPAGRTIEFSGWAVQPDKLSAPVPIAINYGSQWIAFSANQPNSDAPAAVAGAGPNQGFSGTFAAEPGLQTFCVWASRSTGGADQVGCRSVVVPDVKATLGDIQSVTASVSTIDLTGWAVWTAQKTAAVPIAVNIGASWYALSADKPNSAAETALAGSGPNHGYAASIPVPAGTHSVCVWAAQLSAAAVQLGCRTVTVAGVAGAQANIESIAPGASSVNVSGWAVWPSNLAASVPVAVNIGAGWHALAANLPSATAEVAVPGAGADHGFSGSIPVAPGTHSVCVWVSKPTGGAMLVGCQNVTVAGALPVVGELQNASGGVGGVHFSGWAANPASPATSVPIAANIGGTWIPLATGEPNGTAPSKLSGAGPSQGFSGLFPAQVGVHTVCLWASGPTGNVNIGCKTVSVAPAPLVAGAITEASATAGNVAVRGWAVWPSALTTAVSIAANVGAQWVALPSSLPSTVTSKYVLGAGPNQGFAGSIPAASGSQSVCVWAIAPTGPSVSLGCSAVIVP